MFRGLLFLFMLAMLWGGGQSVYTYVTNLEPTSISCDDYIKTGSSAEWLSLTDCWVDNSRVLAVYKEGKKIDKYSDFFIPVYGSSEAANGDPKLFIEEKSMDSRQAFANMYAAENMDEKKVSGFYASHPEELKFISTAGRTDVSGLVEFGIDSDSSVREVIEGQFPDSGEFVILAKDSRPDIKKGGIGLGIGLLLLIYFSRGVLREE